MHTCTLDKEKIFVSQVLSTFVLVLCNCSFKHTNHCNIYLDHEFPIWLAAWAAHINTYVHIFKTIRWHQTHIIRNIYLCKTKQFKHTVNCVTPICTQNHSYVLVGSKINYYEVDNSCAHFFSSNATLQGYGMPKYGDHWARIMLEEATPRRGDTWCRKQHKCADICLCISISIYIMLERCICTYADTLMCIFIFKDL